MPDSTSSGSESKAAKRETRDADPALSRDATFSSYAENADPALDDLNPPTGHHVEQELGAPVEATEVRGKGKS